MVVPFIGDKRQLENEGCSLSTSPQRNKFLKVSAVRKFPSRCGPTPVQVNMQNNEVEGSGKRDGGSSKVVESIVEHGGDCPNKGIRFSENLVESQSKEFPFSSSLSEKATFTLEKSEDVEHGSEEFLDLSVGQGSNNLLKEITIEKPNSSQDLQKMEKESMTKQESDGTSQELFEVKVGSPIPLTNTVVPGLKEVGDDIHNEVVVEGTTMQLNLMQPQHPISSAFVWKGQTFSPQRIVSAARDFPPGCGQNVQQFGEAVDKHFVHNKTVTDAFKDVIVNQDNSCKTKMNWVVCEKTEDKLEAQPESDKYACAKVIMQASQFGNLTDIELKEICKVKEGEHEKVKEKGKYNDEDDGSRCSGDEKIKDCAKDENLTTKSSGVPSSDIELQGITAGVQNEMTKAVVLGLMSATNCPWIKGIETVESSSSLPNVRRSKRKNNVHAQHHQQRCLPDESTHSVENLEDRSKMIVPYLKESETKEICGINNEGHSSENEKLSKDLLTLRRRPLDVTLLPLNAGGSLDEKGAFSNVRGILRLFQTIVRKLVQGEETKNKVRKMKGPENAVLRIDQQALRILKASGKCDIFGKKPIMGPILGVEVGDFFHYRMELCIIGLHRPIQGGIDYQKQGGKNVAVSIVASQGYANDADNSDVLIYTGQGGNGKQPENQKLERGNLALKNSIDEKNVVRVVRGFKETKTSDAVVGKPKGCKTYTYDGLYTVEKYWIDHTNGTIVYKFELKRIPGQPELVWKEVGRSNKFKVREGLRAHDISGGKETFPICAINTIDDEEPPAFVYTTSMIYPDWCKPIPSQGCDCKDGCSDSEQCACAVKNGGEIPYTYDGDIVEAKPLIYECGPTCKCPPTCHNRISQSGIKIPLEIFKTELRGWGVRSLNSIPYGSFICEYIGDVLDDREAEKRTGSDEYLFDIGQNLDDSTLVDGLPAALDSDDVLENVGFTIDALKYGNASRFINHSCSPNLSAQNLLYDHDDRRIPHIMLYAAENIPPLQELSYDYNYAIDKVLNSDGTIKKKNCYCGSSECTGRMY